MKKCPCKKCITLVMCKNKYLNNLNKRARLLLECPNLADYIIKDISRLPNKTYIKEICEIDNLLNIPKYIDRRH